MTNIPNTFGLDVKAKILAEYHSLDELRALLEQYKGERILHIGAGSNLLFTRDFDGVILHSAMRRARATKEDAEHVWIEAENGLVLDDLIAQLCDMGLSGMENLSYIPGEVGASAVQNVGAYGVEAKDVITEVRALDMSDGSERVFTNAECRYGYRDSIFKGELRGKYIITHVTYCINKQFEPKLDYGNLRSEVGENPTPSDVREAVIRIRRQKDDGHIALPADLGADVVARSVGQHDIENAQVKVAVQGKTVHRLLHAVGCDDFAPFVSESDAQPLLNNRVVLHYQ